MESWSNLAKVVYKRTYSRNDTGSFENWEDTVKRTIKGNIQGHNVSESEIKQLESFMLSRKATPGGRGLWFSGAPVHSSLGGVALNNCWGLSAHEWENFVLAQDLLMLGGGVGLSVEHRFVSKLPRVKQATITLKNTKDADFIVPDSREGWCELTSRVLESFFVTGRDFTYSTVCVRGKDEPIKGFGGLSSGPLPLTKLVDKLSGILLNRVGKHIRPIDAMDIICCIGEMVVSGNVRRCLPEGSLVHCERGLVKIEDVEEGDRVLTQDGFHDVTNTFIQGPQQLLKITTQTGSFECTPNHKVAVVCGINEYKWKPASELKPSDRLVFTQSSIPGANTQLPQSEYVRPKSATTVKEITIPTLDTDMAWFLGYFQANGHVDIFNKGQGKRNSVVSVSVPLGCKLEKTIQTQLKRFGVNTKITPGDGNYLNVKGASVPLALWLLEHIKQPNKLNSVPSFILEGTSDIRAAFIAGVMDGDGSIKNKPTIVMSCIHRDYLRSLQSTCASLGIATRLGIVRDEVENWKTLYSLRLVGSLQESKFVDVVSPYSKYKILKCKARKTEQNSYSYPPKFVGGNQNIPVESLDTTIDFLPVTVTDVETSDIKPTYDLEVEGRHEFYCQGYLMHNSAIIILGDPWDREYLTSKRWDLKSVPVERAFANLSVVCSDVEDLHPSFWKTYEAGEPFGIVNRKNMQKYARVGDRKHDSGTLVNPCGESVLEDGEPCNLAELFLPNLNGQKEFNQAARLMFRYCKRVAMEEYHHEKINKIVHKNMRVGVGITGCLQSSLFDPKCLDIGYQQIQKEDVKYSKELGCNESIRTTLIKPSGTLSLIGETLPGIHPAYAPYYVRRVRFSASDKLIPILKDANHPMEPVSRFDGSLDHSTLVVDFFVKSPGNAPTTHEVDTWKQLEHVKMAQRYWADQSISVTVYYKKSEIGKLKEWLSNNLSELKTISFLCHTDHGFDQAPLEEITESQYEKAIEKISPIDFTAISSGDIDSFECEGSCPVK